MLAILGVIAGVALPVTFKLHLSLPLTVGVILEGVALFVLWLQHRNIIDWLRGRRWRIKSDK